MDSVKSTISLLKTPPKIESKTRVKGWYYSFMIIIILIIVLMKVYGIKYYLHISMIKKYPNGIKNRNAEFDKFIESNKYKNIKTYADFIHNPEMMK